MRLQKNLALFSYVAAQLGCDSRESYSALTRALKDTDNARRPDGQSLYFGILEGRGSRLKFRSDELTRYDLNVLAHQEAMAMHRPGFRLTYFQYLAALFSEFYLDRLTKNALGLLQDLEAYRVANFPALPTYTPADLRKLAFWMATGAGKTLLLHLHLRQWQQYRPFEPANILLLTPSEGLSEQHLDELRQSGIECVYALEAPTGFQGVQVLELTKLYVEGESSRARKGGVSISTSVFEGPNLLLVDEGHKGTSGGKKEADTERAWRAIREALVGENGFTFEYSATFAQITEDDDDLMNEYGRAILVDYAYARFHSDGYGKDFRVVNLSREGAFDKDLVLLAGLLTFYEQTRYFQENRSALATYNVEPPLMVFVGAQVTGGDEVLHIVQFLDRVLADPDWATSHIGELLSGNAALPTDLFTHKFPYLRQLPLSAEHLYSDLAQRLFSGSGRLNLHILRKGDGEIGLRTADAARDTYCGVINVGDAAKFLNHKAVPAGINKGADDHLTDSLFDAIDKHESPVRFLIGSKKFVEGWSSWRVSTMGLMKVGKKAGAQVIQLFGRGVRLKGKDMGLRRSSVLHGDHPAHLSLLETLGIFGLEANYLDTFRETIEREGLPEEVVRVLPVVVALPPAPPLKVLEPAATPFKESKIIQFDAKELPTQALHLDLSPRFSLGEGVQSGQNINGVFPEHPFPFRAVSTEEIYLHALEHKTRRGFFNLYITRPAVKEMLESARLTAHRSILSPDSVENLNKLSHAGCSLAEKAIDRFYFQQQSQHESAKLRAVELDEEHSNFPRSNGNFSYEVRVRRSKVDDIDNFIKEFVAGGRPSESGDEPLPRLYIDFHLYNPILVRGRYQVANGRLHVHEGSSADIVTKPTGLVDSEAKFVHDLRSFWQLVHSQEEWSECRIHLLRNLPRRGVGFFSTAGFFPDFLLWIVRGERQALAFVEPKGLTYLPEEKLEILKYIRGLSLGLPTLAYVVTPTKLESIGAMSSRRYADRHALGRDHILLQEDVSYIGHMLEEMRSSLS